jgi:hypothetical protein
MLLLNQFRFLAAAVLFLLLFIILYPLYQYIFDLDAIGYMMVTKRLANGDYYNAINGMWSPLHSWLIVPFYKMGVNEIMAFKGSNAVISLAVLASLNRLMKKILIPDNFKTVIIFICVPILLWYSYFQIAADILVCLPLLWYINIICEEDFFEKKTAQVLCAVVGSVAYLSKSYLFPYFILHFSLVQLYLYRNSASVNRKKILRQNLLTGLGIFVVLCSGWIAALSFKFHKFTIGFAGEYNHKLSTLSRPAEKVILVPPFLPGSPHVWEDISYADLGSYNTLSPLQLILKQVRVILFQFMEMLKNFNELSVFALAIILASFIYLNRNKNHVLSIFLLTIITLPMGYLLMHIETRYLWVNAFLLIIGGTFLLNKLLSQFEIVKPVRLICWFCFYASFLIYPVDGLKDAVGRHKEVFVLADEVKKLNLKGSFASNDVKDVMGRMAYLTSNTYLTQYDFRYTQQEFIRDMKEKNVDYYFFFYQHAGQLEDFMNQDMYRTYGKAPIRVNNELLVLPINAK